MTDQSWTVVLVRRREEGARGRGLCSLDSSAVFFLGRDEVDAALCPRLGIS